MITPPTPLRPHHPCGSHRPTQALPRQLHRARPRHFHGSSFAPGQPRRPHARRPSPQPSCLTDPRQRRAWTPLGGHGSASPLSTPLPASSHRPTTPSAPWHLKATAPPTPQPPGAAASPTSSSESSSASAARLPIPPQPSFPTQLRPRRPWSPFHGHGSVARTAPRCPPARSATPCPSAPAPPGRRPHPGTPAPEAIACPPTSSSVSASAALPPIPPKPPFPTRPRRRGPPAPSTRHCPPTPASPPRHPHPSLRSPWHDPRPPRTDPPPPRGHDPHPSRDDPASSA